MPLDQLCLSGQCGFSSTVEGNALTYDQQVAKLRLIVDTAHEHLGLAHASVTPTQQDLPESLPELLSDVALTGAFGGSAGAPVLEGAPVGLGAGVHGPAEVLAQVGCCGEAAFLRD